MPAITPVFLFARRPDPVAPGKKLNVYLNFISRENADKISPKIKIGDSGKYIMIHYIPLRGTRITNYVVFVLDTIWA